MSEITTLPVLFKQTTTGAVQQWSVSSQGDKVTVQQGQVAGAMQTYDTICTPKNVGKKNESSGQTQAFLEAKAKWKKQLKKGYVKDPSGEVSVMLPMKVNEYLKHRKKITFPCYSSYKLNGVNSEFRWPKEGVKFLSRGGEEYPAPIYEAELELKELCALLGEERLNYEIYKHGEWLQDIQSAVKKPTRNYR